jgi:hypothetical protein
MAHPLLVQALGKTNSLRKLAIVGWRSTWRQPFAVLSRCSQAPALRFDPAAMNFLLDLDKDGQKIRGDMLVNLNAKRLSDS